jgi:hypothetical protein
VSRRTPSPVEDFPLSFLPSRIERAADDEMNNILATDEARRLYEQQQRDDAELRSWA